MSCEFSEQILWSNFCNIQKILCLSDSDFAQFLEINAKTLENLKKSKTSLPLDIAVILSEKLHFDIEDFLMKDLDMDAISAAYFKIDQLPERYRTAAFSRARTLTHIFDYIEKKQGKLRKNIILRKFQTNGEFFNNPDNILNINFITDLTEHLHSLGYTKEDFFQMGRNSVKVNSQGLIVDVLTDAKSLLNGFERFVYQIIPMFDRNFEYRISKFAQGELSISVSPKAEAQDALGVKVLANAHICQIKTGMLSTIPLYLGISKFATVAITHSMYHGDFANVYAVDLNSFSGLSSNRDSGFSSVYQ